jgi:hypothetical protein
VTQRRFWGRTSGIDGVVDSSGTITGARVEWGDPVDLPVDDGVAGLVVFHVPRFLDPGRHHRRSPAEYLAWLVEVIDEAERVLEPGGRLVLITKPHESIDPHIDIPSQLLDPLATAGFTTPEVRTWLRPTSDTHLHAPQADNWAVLEDSARSWWRILITSKTHQHRTGTARQRHRLGLPHTAGSVPDHLIRLAGRSHWPITTTPPDAPVTQGNLPDELVALVLSVYSYLDDVVICPLTGPSSTVVEVARRLGRRALCFEPDQDVLARYHTTRPGQANHTNRHDRHDEGERGER